MKFFTISSVAGWFYRDALFRIKTNDKVVCLTFDDGPDPDSTPVILEILDKHNVKAAFFCDGRAAETYPRLVDMIRLRGHRIGNHGYNHLNGWVTSQKEYCKDVNYASRFTSDRLFRPPYGLLRYNQYRHLRNTYKIVFWDIMPYDFDRGIESDRSLEILNKRIRSGSVIVLHDRQDSTAVHFLDEFLYTAVSRGFGFLCPEWD